MDAARSDTRITSFRATRATWEIHTPRTHAHVVHVTPHAIRTVHLSTAPDAWGASACG